MLVLQLVPAPLAGAVLQCLAKARHSQELPMPSSENLVWKCAHYVPMIARGPRTAAPLLASLTALQKDCLQLPMVRIASSRSLCLCGAELKAKKPADGATISNNCTTFATSTNRYKVYSLAGGQLWADFVELQCRACQRCFLGHWSFRRPQSVFRHIADLQCHESASDGFFVVPRYRSYYAVEVALLRHITDCLHFCGFYESCRLSVGKSANRSLATGFVVGSRPNFATAHHQQFAVSLVFLACVRDGRAAAATCGMGLDACRFGCIFVEAHYFDP